MVKLNHGLLMMFWKEWTPLIILHPYACSSNYEILYKAIIISYLEVSKYSDLYLSLKCYSLCATLFDYTEIVL